MKLINSYEKLFGYSIYKFVTFSIVSYMSLPSKGGFPQTNS
jgi:hypothetical protein